MPAAEEALAAGALVARAVELALSLAEGVGEAVFLLLACGRSNTRTERRGGPTRQTAVAGGGVRDNRRRGHDRAERRRHRAVRRVALGRDDGDGGGGEEGGGETHCVFWLVGCLFTFVWRVRKRLWWCGGKWEWAVDGDG
jgi:hypothetical protein